MTNKKEIKKYCLGIDCLTCDETEPCIYRIANKLQDQLKYKEQECEEINLTNERLVAEKYIMNEEILKLKQALDEIEEIANKQRKFDLTGKTPLTPVINEVGEDFIDILDIIKKAKE